MLPTSPAIRFYAYYKRYYAPNNMTTVIVGDIEPGRHAGTGEEVFRQHSTRSDARRPVCPADTADESDLIEIKKDIDHRT